MHIVNIHEAKTHLSRLLSEVAAGEEVVIAKSGRPIARLTAYSAPSSTRNFGRDQGLFEVPEDFDAPLPDDLHKLFEG